jgi:hypothetical protein
MSGERIPQSVIDDLVARTDIVELIGARVELKKAGREFRACCPFHADNTPSFYVVPDKQFWNCFGCGANGNAIGFLMEFDKLPFRVAIEALGGAGAHSSEPRRPPPAKRASVVPIEWSGRAESYWRRTEPLAGTIGETYLHHRGCVVPPPDSDLRFLTAIEGEPPRLCGRITDALTGKPISLHFTFLAADGRGKAGRIVYGERRDKDYLRGHLTRGGCVRLWPDECVTSGLALGEGIESTLAAAHIFRPAWAAMDAGHMETFPVLDGIDSLTIFADNDESSRGINAAQVCAERWRHEARDARIFMPRTLGQDCADVVAA